MKKLPKNKNYQDFINLAPTSNAKNIEEYSEILDYALNQEDILNIAVLGNYGSGKSSFIKTYFKDKEAPIIISLGSYSKEKNKAENENKNEYHQTIEKSILQQLLYQTDQNIVPQSRFKRLTNYSKKELFLKVSLFFVLFLICVFCFVPNFFKKIIDIIKYTYKSLGFLNLKIKNINFYTDLLITFILYFIIVLFIVFCIFKICEYIRNNFYISKLKYKDTEIEINDKEESIFNKYLDEIVYFFQCTTNSIVVFEDIDRFEDAIIIIEKLKELNYLLNTSFKINRKIKFIYCIKDDFFEIALDRTKFFDKTIPIIPVSSFSNSNEIIWEKFEKIYGKKEKYYEIDKKFIDSISIFIDDMRLINNIMSDFVLYSDKFIEKNLDNKKLFALIVYKNLYPKKYSDMISGIGTIPDIIRKRIDVINDILVETNNLKNEKMNNINKIKSEKLNNISELKNDLVMSIIKYDLDLKESQYFKFNDQKVCISEFLDENFDMERIEKERVDFHYNRYQYSEKNENDVFKKYNGKPEFLKRAKILIAGCQRSVDLIQQEITNLEKYELSIKEMSVSQLIEKFGIEKFSDKVEDFENYILLRDLIDSDYYDYMTLFKEGNLTIADMQFVKDVKKRNINNYDYHLVNLEEIINRLDIYDYSSPAVYNFDLFDYIFSKSSIIDIVVENKIVDLFKNIDNNKLDFLEKYMKQGLNWGNFIEKILMKENNIWDYIYKYKGTDAEYIDKWLLEFIKKKEYLNNIDQNFIEYINNHRSFYKIYKLLNEQSKNNLIDLNVKFIDCSESIDKDFLEFIYKNDLYEINDCMLKIMLDFNCVSSDEYYEKFLTIIENEKMSIMKKYIYLNMEIYLNNCYKSKKTQKNDENIIIKLINNESISDNSKILISSKEKNRISNVEKIADKYLDVILIFDKAQYNWNNIVYLYNYFNKIDEHLANIINNVADFEISQFDKFNDKQKFYKDIFNCEYIKIDVLKKYALEFKIDIDNLNEFFDSADVEKLNLIIENNYAQFNIENFQYVKNISKDLLVNFININQDNYIEEINDYDVHDIIDNLLDNSKLDTIVKINLLESTAIDIKSIDINLLYELLVKDEYKDIRSKEINEYIFDSSLSKIKKINYLTLLKEELEFEQMLIYLSKINSVFDNIGITKRNFSVYNEGNVLEIINFLKENNIISSYKLLSTNNIMIYNKKRDLVH